MKNNKLSKKVVYLTNYQILSQYILNNQCHEIFF